VIKYFVRIAFSADKQGSAYVTINSIILRGIVLPLVAVPAISALFMRCAIPEDPSQDPENVILSILQAENARDSLIIGDSLRLEIAVSYPHLVDSLLVRFGDSLLPPNRKISDTVAIHLLPYQPGTFFLDITAYCRDGVITRTADTIVVKGIPPVIVVQPKDTSIIEGSAAVFSIVASGNPFPAIQWYRDSMAISGATADSFRIDSVTTAMNGLTYRARLGGSVDTIWSEAAVLTVIAAPSRWDMLRWDAAAWW
jgi:hypothetical protein